MDCSAQRRHNPVESITRKLQSIQRLDNVADSPFHIPKLRSSNYDCPQAGLRYNLDALLKQRTVQGQESGGGVEEVRAEMLAPMPSPRPSQTVFSSTPVVPCMPASRIPHPENTTFSITSTLGESNDSSCLSFSSGTQFSQVGRARPDSGRSSRIPTEPQTHGPPPIGGVSYNLNIPAAEAAKATGALNEPTDHVYGATFGVETKKEATTMTEVRSSIEEDLLDTIFDACDTQRRGRVFVSRIVDYLRHATSRDSEDSGLEELCNMLDPEGKDVSIDLDTYHSVMTEWIEECRNNEIPSAESLLQDSVFLNDSLTVKRSALLSMTSGSLEALGGEVSSTDIETSEALYCMAALQHGNQRLQEDVAGLKRALEAMEDTNQRLAEDNETLRSQARLGQQLAQKEKLLKEEMEDMKITLNGAEEGRTRAAAHSKRMERENQVLNAKITTLQEENIKVTMEMDDIQRRVTELGSLNSELQAQIHSFNGVLTEKDALLLQSNGQIEELKASVLEYSTITEVLRAEKARRESQLHLMHPDAGLPLSVAYRLSQSSQGSLQTELALAQNPLKQRDIMEDSPSDSSTLRDLRTPQYLEVKWAKKCLSLEKELVQMACNVWRSRTQLRHLSVRVQEQENQNQQLKDELQQLKMPQDSREASCQTPDGEQEAGEDLDWDEEFVLQDFLRTEGNEHCRAESGRQTDGGRPCEEDGGEGKEEEGERWTVVGGEAQEEPRGASALSSPVRSTPPGRSAEEEETESTLQGPDLKQTSEAVQEAKLPACTGLSDAHPQAVSSDKLSPPSHTEACDEVSPALAPPEGPALDPIYSPDHDRTITPGHSLPGAKNMVHPSCASLAVDETITMRESYQLPESSESRTGGGQGEEDTPTVTMDNEQRLSPEQQTDRTVGEDSTSPLPVLVEEEEEEEGQTPIQVATVEVDMAGTARLGGEGAASLSNGKSPQTTVEVTISGISQSEAMIPDPSQSEDCSGAPTAKNDSLAPKGKVKKELEVIRSVEAIEERGVVEDMSETSVATEKEVETSAISEDDSTREERISLSASEKEIEKEFQRLSLSFKCDSFTLEKRLRLEERSRDLAEDNVRREVSSCQGLLQALIPLCEDDNQSMEIIQRLQKNLDILIQSMTRVSSRSEMLGAIHQESKVEKSVEVMIHHVDNLRRMYTKEHSELMDLRETLMQNERSFGSHSTGDDRAKRQSGGSQFYKSPTARRVSMPTVRHFDMSKPQDATETEAERLTRRSPWNVTGKSSVRPPLKRFVTSGGWGEVDEHTLMKGSALDQDSHSEDERREEPNERKSSLTELGNKLSSFIMPLKTPSPISSSAVAQNAAPSLPLGQCARAALAGTNRGVWLWLALVVGLAVLVALLASMAMVVDAAAAPTGTGGTWMTIQKLLWPYTGLRYNGQPPV